MAEHVAEPRPADEAEQPEDAPTPAGLLSLPPDVLALVATHLPSPVCVAYLATASRQLRVLSDQLLDAHMAAARHSPRQQGRRVQLSAQRERHVRERLPRLREAHYGRPEQTCPEGDNPDPQLLELELALCSLAAQQPPSPAAAALCACLLSQLPPQARACTGTDALAFAATAGHEQLCRTLLQGGAQAGRGWPAQPWLVLRTGGMWESVSCFCSTVRPGGCTSALRPGCQPSRAMKRSLSC